MNKAAFEDYLTNRYEEQMKYYAKSSRENRDKYRKFQWALIILSAIAPVLIALDGVRIAGDAEHPVMLNIKLITVIITSVVAILTTGLKTFNYFENYVRYRNTREEMKREIHFYNFRVGPYSEHGINKESLFVSRVESILDKEHTQWPESKKLQEQDKDKDKEKQHEDPVVPATPSDESVPADNTDELPPAPEASAEDQGDKKP
ncbi:MAG: DUF4231 domain-containing protein [Chitinophagales bacterium]|nr:DUF4231 domain-containing protein [Chitinophagales bacterium]